MLYKEEEVDTSIQLNEIKVEDISNNKPMKRKHIQKQHQEEEIQRQNSKTVWTEEQENLLISWAEKASGYAWLHSQCISYYKRRNWCISIPASIFGYLAGATTLLTTASLEDPYIRGVVGFSAILSGIFSNFQQMFTFKELTEQHRLSTLRFMAFFRDISSELSMNPIHRNNPIDYITMKRLELDKMLEQSPSIPDKIISLYNKKSSHLSLHKPEISNILQTIVPYKKDKTKTQNEEKNKYTNKMLNKILEKYKKKHKTLHRKNTSLNEYQIEQILQKIIKKKCNDTIQHQNRNRSSSNSVNPTMNNANNNLVVEIANSVSNYSDENYTQQTLNQVCKNMDETHTSTDSVISSYSSYYTSSSEKQTPMITQHIPTKNIITTTKSMPPIPNHIERKERSQSLDETKEKIPPLPKSIHSIDLDSENRENTREKRKHSFVSIDIKESVSPKQQIPKPSMPPKPNISKED